MDDDKIFKYRGKTYEEIEKLSFKDFTKLLTSELRRKIKRGFTVEEVKLLNKIERGEKNIKTHCRDMIIIPQLVGQKIGIHKGNEFVQINITPEMLGFRLGEFAPTRKIGVKHSGKQDATKKGKEGDKK